MKIKKSQTNKKMEIPFQNALLRNNSSLIHSYNIIKSLELPKLKKISIIKKKIKLKE